MGPLLMEGSAHEEVLAGGRNGNGPVDFKVPQAFNGRVVMEMKLSTGKLVAGYARQPKTYKKRSKPREAIMSSSM